MIVKFKGELKWKKLIFFISSINRVCGSDDQEKN